MKRRNFEETVKRAKALKAARDLERKEREQEMTRLKKAHDLEIQQLKQKLESRDVGLTTMVPTKANPYATIHNSDSFTNCQDRRRSSTEVRPDLVLQNPLGVSVPAFVLRGYGGDSHYEYEVKISLLGETWIVFRRYRRFREMQQYMKAKYPATSKIPFPPKRFFGNKSEKVVAQRRKQLEDYLRRLFELCRSIPGCPLHVSNSALFSKQCLWEFSNFFKKGIFETTKHGTA